MVVHMVNNDSYENMGIGSMFTIFGDGQKYNFSWILRSISLRWVNYSQDSELSLEGIPNHYHSIS